MKCWLKIILKLNYRTCPEGENPETAAKPKATAPVTKGCGKQCTGP